MLELCGTQLSSDHSHQISTRLTQNNEEKKKIREIAAKTNPEFNNGFVK